MTEQQREALVKWLRVQAARIARLADEQHEQNRQLQDLLEKYGITRADLETPNETGETK